MKNLILAFTLTFISISFGYGINSNDYILPEIDEVCLSEKIPNEPLANMTYEDEIFASPCLELAMAVEAHILDMDEGDSPAPGSMASVASWVANIVYDKCCQLFPAAC